MVRPTLMSNLILMLGFNRHALGVPFSLPYFQLAAVVLSPEPSMLGFALPCFGALKCGVRWLAN